MKSDISQSSPASALRDREAKASFFKKELLAAAATSHLSLIAFSVPIFMLLSVADYFQFPDHWVSLLIPRLAIIPLALLSVWLYRKNRLDAYWMAVLPLSAMGMHCGAVLSVIPAEMLLTINVSILAFFMILGWVAVLPMRHIIVVGVLTLASGLFFVFTSTSYTVVNWLDNGGPLMILGPVTAILAIRARYRMRRLEIESRYALNASLKELDTRNQSLTLIKSELETANLKLESSNQDLEKKVEERTASITKAIQERNELVYRLSHDFKTPMINIKSMMIMARKMDDPAQLSTVLDMVVKSLGKFEDLVKNLERFASYSSSEPSIESFDLQETVREVWENAKGPNPESIRLEIKDDLAVPVHSDRKKLALVLDCLIRNSIQYRRDGAEGILHISAKTDAESLTLTVEDNGVGIRPEVLPRIFDMFYRGDERSTGLGIGLYLAKGLIDQLEGNIEVSSNQFGTTMQIHLPRVAG